MAWNNTSSNTQALTSDVEQLFAPDAERSASPGPQPASTAAVTAFGGGATPLNTLDESVWQTVKRDLVRIAKNLWMVVFPFKDRSAQNAALRNWDLWGPMIFTLTLAISLSVGPNIDSASSVFSLVFAVVTLGAVMLTLNVVLLGGNIGFFQALCLLGYCVFPLAVASLITGIVHNIIARWVVVAVCLVWSSWACVPFVAGSVGEQRRVLAIYPVFLLYTSIAWLAIVH